jgi:hypothetical protein
VRLLPRLDAALVSAVRCGAVKMKVVLLVACLSGPAVCLAIFAVALAFARSALLASPVALLLTFSSAHSLTTAAGCCEEARSGSHAATRGAATAARRS